MKKRTEAPRATLRLAERQPPLHPGLKSGHPVGVMIDGPSCRGIQTQPRKPNPAATRRPQSSPVRSLARHEQAQRWVHGPPCKPSRNAATPTRLCDPSPTMMDISAIRSGIWKIPWLTPSPIIQEYRPTTHWPLIHRSDPACPLRNPEAHSFYRLFPH